MLPAHAEDLLEALARSNSAMQCGLGAVFIVLQLVQVVKVLPRSRSLWQ